MESIRGRLTIWYATALILSIAVFAVVLYVARRSATYQDLDRRIQSEANLIAGILAKLPRPGPPSKRIPRESRSSFRRSPQSSKWSRIFCW
jgi:hypothetical protein